MTFRLETVWVVSGIPFFVVVALIISACTKNPTAPAGSSSCTYTNSPTSVNVGASGGTSTVTITVTGSSCSWTATSNAAFVTVTSASSGTGTGTVTLTIAANAGAARSGTVTIAGQAVTINQDAAPAVVCTYTLSSSVVAAAAAGGTSTLIVTAPSTCSWTTTSNAAFITVASGTSGTGIGTVSLTIAANTGAARSGTVTVAGQTVTVNQEAAAPVACTYTLSTTTISAGASGGASTVTVTAPSTCGWTAVSNAVFITIPSGTSGTGNGTVTLAIAANTGAARSGTLTIAGQTVTVNQGASGLVASFALFDPAAQTAATTECQFRSLAGQPTTCTLQSTSFTFGANTIVSYTWTVQYTYVTVKTLTQSGPSPTFSFTDVCGQFSSTNDGVAQPLSVQLTVVDSLGATATASAGTGGQPPLQVRLFACGL